MTLNKEQKEKLSQMVLGDLESDTDVAYVRMLLDVKQKELDAAKPRGMKSGKGGFFGF
jgi:hypothetical protein